MKGGATSGRGRLAGLLADIVLVARQELDDAIRTKRAVVVLVIYLAGAALTFNGIIAALHRTENQISEAVGLKASSSTGAVTKALWASRPFRGMLESLVGDKQAARELLSIPPMALLYGWLALMFVGPLTMLTSAGRIAEEVGSGSARLALLRTSRPAWCLGKFVGQALLLYFALMLSVAGAWVVARLRLSGMNGAETLAAMLVLAAKIWLYGLAMTGLALGISQMTRSLGLATALSLVAWIAMGILSAVARHRAGPGWRRLWEVVLLLTPESHRLDLFRMDLAHVVPAAVFLLTLALVYLLAGFAVLSRKDL